MCNCGGKRRLTTPTTPWKHRRNKLFGRQAEAQPQAAEEQTVSPPEEQQNGEEQQQAAAEAGN